MAGCKFKLQNKSYHQSEVLQVRLLVRLDADLAALVGGGG
jgi:hypothetical protein